MSIRRAKAAGMPAGGGDGLLSNRMETGRGLCSVEGRKHRLTRRRVTAAASAAPLPDIATAHVISVPAADITFGTGALSERGAGIKPSLRISVHDELVTDVARRGTAFRSISTLKDKWVNVGNPGSGQRPIAQGRAPLQKKWRKIGIGRTQEADEFP
jgi:TRAP-type uncharacterized transport system, periplasmic component